MKNLLWDHLWGPGILWIFPQTPVLLMGGPKQILATASASFLTFYADLPQGMDKGNSTAYKLGGGSCRKEIWSLCDTPGVIIQPSSRLHGQGCWSPAYLKIVFNKCWELNVISCHPGNQGHSVEKDGDGRRPRYQQTHCTWSKEHKTGWWVGKRVGGGF